jgi:hypothetical protein
MKLVRFGPRGRESPASSMTRAASATSQVVGDLAGERCRQSLAKIRKTSSTSCRW